MSHVLFGTTYAKKSMHFYLKFKYNWAFDLLNLATLIMRHNVGTIYEPKVLLLI